MVHPKLRHKHKLVDNNTINDESSTSDTMNDEFIARTLQNDGYELRITRDSSHSFNLDKDDTEFEKILIVKDLGSEIFMTCKVD